MSRFEPRAPGARLTRQGEARRLPDPPRSPAVWRIPPKWTNLIPALAGFLFSDPARAFDETVASWGGSGVPLPLDQGSWAVAGRQVLVSPGVSPDPKGRAFGRQQNP